MLILEWPRGAKVHAAAHDVAQAAELWNSEAYAQFHRLGQGAPNADDSQEDNLDGLTERTETLSELWADIAAA
jgi:hypothetical protein